MLSTFSVSRVRGLMKQTAPKIFRRSPSRQPRSATRDKKDEKAVGPPYPLPPRRHHRTWHGLKDFLTSTKLLLLLVFVPCSIVSGALGVDSNVVFVFSILAILPLAMLLSNATEELANEAGEVIGALLNATFGNAVEMIVSDRSRNGCIVAHFVQVSTVALTRGDITIVQSSMLGAILSNILLVCLDSTCIICRR